MHPKSLNRLTITLYYQSQCAPFIYFLEGFMKKISVPLKNVSHIEYLQDNTKKSLELLKINLECDKSLNTKKFWKGKRKLYVILCLIRRGFLYVKQKTVLYTRTFCLTWLLSVKWTNFLSILQDYSVKGINSVS